VADRTYREPHTHLVDMPCLHYWDCNRAGPEMAINFGPITGTSEVARQLILHFEIDPEEHEGLLLEVDQAIGDEMLVIAREIFAERGIPIPAEVGALPMTPPSKPGRRRGRRTTGSSATGQETPGTAPYSSKEADRG
jgi:hypothetical protein